MKLLKDDLVLETAHFRENPMGIRLEHRVQGRAGEFVLRASELAPRPRGGEGRFQAMEDEFINFGRNAGGPRGRDNNAPGVNKYALVEMERRKLVLQHANGVGGEIVSQEQFRQAMRVSHCQMV